MDKKLYFKPSIEIYYLNVERILCLSDDEEDTDTGGTGSDMPWG